MSITTVNDHLIHYEVLGRGRPVLFVHGWLGSWRYWWPSMQGLSAHHRSFAIDLWGFGDSSKLKNGYSISAYVHMLNEFIDQLGVARPLTLIGHGLGAITSLKYAMKYPEHVEKLVTVALPLKGSDLDQRLATFEPGAFISKVLGKSQNFPEIENELRKTDHEAVTKLTQEIIKDDYSNDLANCACPVLVMHGGNDGVVQLPTDNNSRHNAASSRYYVKLDNCAHFPMLEEKSKFNRLLLEFIHSDDSLTELAPKEYWQRRVR
ncbi:MAG: alpha/beta hydrolase [Chloroflexi bacterium]|nr:alpha/beta hydrolase [Chloroflexota bacterium]